MEIGKCSCGHHAVNYYNIHRHYTRLLNGKQLYSNSCMEPNCRCERARIIKHETDKVIQAEKQKWAKVIQQALG